VNGGCVYGIDIFLERVDKMEKYRHILL
jgi:hypothetical protein